jgi:hypothetical protein
MLDAPLPRPAIPVTPPAAPAFTPNDSGDVPATAAALGAALAAATVRPGDAVVELEAAVGAYVRALRAGGAPPEAAVIAVKHVMEAAGVPRRPTPDALAFAARVVTWCIEAYYRPD